MSNKQDKTEKLLVRLRFVRDEGVISGDSYDTQAGYVVTSGSFGSISRAYDERELEVWESLVPVRRIEGSIPKCPACTARMVLRVGAYGPFWGCSRYGREPSCRETRPVSGETKKAFLDPSQLATRAEQDHLVATYVPRYEALFSKSAEIGREVEDSTAIRVIFGNLSVGDCRLGKEDAQVFRTFVEREERKISKFHEEAAKRVAEAEAAKAQAELDQLQVRRRKRAKFGQIVASMKND